MSSALKSWGL